MESYTVYVQKQESRESDEIYWNPIQYVQKQETRESDEIYWNPIQYVQKKYPQNKKSPSIVYILSLNSVNFRIKILIEKCKKKFWAFDMKNLCLIQCCGTLLKGFESVLNQSYCLLTDCIHISLEH